MVKVTKTNRTTGATTTTTKRLTPATEKEFKSNAGRMAKVATPIKRTTARTTASRNTKNRKDYLK